MPMHAVSLPLPVRCSWGNSPISTPHLDVAVGDAQAVAVVHRHDELLEQAPAQLLRQAPALAGTRGWSQRHTVRADTGRENAHVSSRRVRRL